MIRFADNKAVVSSISERLTTAHGWSKQNYQRL